MVDIGRAGHAGWRLSSTALIACLLSLFFGCLFFALSRLSSMQPSFHVGFNENWPAMIAVPVCLTAAIGTAFVFANFSFGYFVGFYFFMMMAGYFWVNTFSILKYDHTASLLSAAASITMFLLPALMMRAPAPTLTLPRRIFEWLPEAA